MSDNAENVKGKKPIYKKWWFWLIIVIVIIFAASQGENNKNSNNTNTINNGITNNQTSKKAEVKVIDFSTMDKTAIQNWGDTNKVKINITDEYSNDIKKGSFIRQSVTANTIIHEGDEINIAYFLGKEPTNEEKNALAKAEQYSNTMNMSKQGIYDQLTSKYGEKFSTEAAQYAIDNMTADFNANALAKAKNYQQTMNMSKQSIYDQLISTYGEKFTKTEAKYAIDHLED